MTTAMIWCSQPLRSSHPSSGTMGRTGILNDARVYGPARWMERIAVSNLSYKEERERERRISSARKEAPAAAAANPNRHQTFLRSAGTQSGRRAASTGPADGQNPPTHSATWDPVLPAGQHATRLPQGNYTQAHKYTYTHIHHGIKNSDRIYICLNLCLISHHCLLPLDQILP